MSLWREPESRLVDGSLPELIFELEWKKATKLSGKREDIRARIGIWDPPDPTLDLLSFKSYLCQNLGLSGDVAVSYVDSDGDELPIDSDCEFREALKFARARTKKFKNVLLMIDKIEKQGASFDKTTSRYSSQSSPCGGLFVIPPKSTSITSRNNMAPIVMNDLIESGRKPQENFKPSPSLPSSSSEAIPPIWFKSYMETLKNDIVKEVSTKVMADVMGVLNKGRSEPCPSCSHAAPRGIRNARETNNEDKLHRKKKKRVVEEVESSDAFSPPQQPDVQLLRKVKKIEKRERNLQRKLDHKLERLEQMTRIIVETKNRCHDVAAIAKNLNKGCKLNETSADPLPALAPPQEAQTKEYDAVSKISSSAESSRPRMNCSVTGHEMLENTTSKEVVYESDSDSDNISIISGISNVSDLDHDYNFEMIQTPPCFILDKPLNLSLNNRESENSKVPEKLDNSTPATPEKQVFNVVCEAESDRNNNRDSPSYEVLSGPASSTSSIHLDEDHFHISRNLSEQIPNADLIDLNHDDTGAKKGSALVVDSQGKIFDKYIVDDTNELSEMYLDKRPGGAYAFVNETLPIHIKDPSQMSKSETNVEELIDEDNCNLNLNMKSSHPSYETKERNATDEIEIQTATRSQSNFQSQTDSASGTTHESTQSFSSHSCRAGGNNVRNFTQAQTRTVYGAPRYTVVDNNASKGLGETKYTSFENNLGARGCQAQRNERTNETRGGKYQRGFTSEDAGCVFTEQPQKSSPENGTRESSPDFGRPTNDSVHILPETLVSGAVTLASSAYSTARKAFDRIRNMQTGEGQEPVQDGITIGTHIEEYCALLEEMGFMNADLNARLLDQFNYDVSRVISELVQ